MLQVFYCKEKNAILPPHECPKNHLGSSKSMECEAIFRMVLEAHRDLNYTIAVIISDDDSNMRANLKHSYKELVENNLMSDDE